MDFVVELILEIVLEGSMEVLSERKVPMPLRIIALMICFIFYVGLGGFLIFMGYEAMIDKDVVAAILCFTVGFGFLIGVFYLFRKKFKEKQKKNQER